MKPTPAVSAVGSIAPSPHPTATPAALVFPNGTLTFDSNPIVHETGATIGAAIPWIVALVIILRFAKSIESLFSRVKTVPTPWGSADMNSPPQEAVAKVDVDVPPLDQAAVQWSVKLSDSDGIDESNISRVIASSAHPTSEDLKKIKVELEKTSDDAKRWASAWAFERLHNQLYGSQLTLCFVAENPGSIGPAHIRQFYKLGTDNGYQGTFDDWVRVLLDSELLKESDGPNDIKLYWGTEKCREFVKYMREQHLSNYKPF